MGAKLAKILFRKICRVCLACFAPVIGYCGAKWSGITPCVGFARLGLSFTDDYVVVGAKLVKILFRNNRRASLVCFAPTVDYRGAKRSGITPCLGFAWQVFFIVDFYAVVGAKLALLTTSQNLPCLSGKLRPYRWLLRGRLQPCETIKARISLAALAGLAFSTQQLKENYI